MKHTGKRALVLAIAALMALALVPASASASSALAQVEYPDEIVIADGVTQPVFGYSDAIRERVWVEADFDSDMDGVKDLVAMDIMRPAKSADGLEVPVVMDASPYYTTSCRGNESQCISDTNGDGINDRWPLFYDNYFVPRGYAVVLLHMAGTASSTGCPVTGGTPDNLSAVAAIDWLNGRRPGINGAGESVVADWHNGHTGMIGKSYDGTLANAAAATGVEGLSTIVPISAISSWYDYSRSNGIRFNTNYPSSLSNTVTNAARRAYCAPIRTILNDTDGDETGDFTDFWVERDYHKDIDNVDTPVFVIHGLQDNNVKTDHASKWWYGLAERDVPRKIWLNRSGHEDPFDFNRAYWVETIHRWFDHHLQGVENGIMDEPMADVEYAANEWVKYDTWPVPNSTQTNLYFNPVGTGSAGTLDLTQPAMGTTQSYVDRSNQSEAQAVNTPNNANPNRLVYLSEPLTAPLHISGTPELKLKAKVNDTFTNFGVVLMEYTGASRAQVTTTSDGVANVPGSPRDCWGPEVVGDFSSCYIQTQTNTTNQTQWRVSKGIVDGQNIYDYTTQTPLRPNKWYNFDYVLLPNDYVFPVGSRIGVVLVGSYSGYSSVAVTNAAEVTIDLGNSRISLPIVGGKRAAFDAGITDSNRG